MQTKSENDKHTPTGTDTLKRQSVNLGSTLSAHINKVQSVFFKVIVCLEEVVISHSLGSPVFHLTANFFQ